MREWLADKAVMIGAIVIVILYAAFVALPIFI